MGTDQAEGVRDGAGWRRRAQGYETVPGEGGAYWSLCVPMGRARSGLPQEPLWGIRGLKIERKLAILRIYGF